MLVVSNASGCTDTLRRNAFVRVQPPHVQIINIPQQGCEPFTYFPSIQIQSVEVRKQADFADAFEVLARQSFGALIVADAILTFLRMREIVEFASANRLPTMNPFREFTDAGGLISYGANVKDMIKRTAGYVDKILRGANPAGMPIEQPTKFELVINLKTAKALGLTVPRSVLLRADEVIK
jgi:putative ABC transport system substrate-binding protein